MATGDQADIQSRLRQLVPPNWLPAGLTPIYDALLSGIANALSFAYGLFAYVRLQTRIATATDGFLDLIAADFFGSQLARGPGETDGSYRARIKAGIFRERGTRRSVVLILQQLTGRAPIIFEPQRAADTGGYGRAGSNSSLTGAPTGQSTGLFYGKAGGYGSTKLQQQAFVTAFRPIGKGIPNVAGYGISVAGYGVPSQSEYASLSMIETAVSDADIYAAINSVRPTCATLWTRIQS
jgi:hypothetical protein